MPALDQCHPQVVRALENDGWQVESSPYKLESGVRRSYVDLLLSRQVNGTREQAILVEVKCFVDPNARTTDIYIAIGQYIIYETMMAEIGINEMLYLVIPETIYREVIDDIIVKAFRQHGIHIVIIDLVREEVVEWKRSWD
jgi:hypothetical protein